MKKLLQNKKGLTIIEIMVGIFIFTLGISAIFMVVSSTVAINNYNKNYIIASNLAREQIELIRNIRDTNYEKLQKWNITDPNTNDFSTVGEFVAGNTSLYKLENRYSGTTEFPIMVSTGSFITQDAFKTALKTLTDTTEDEYRLCLNSNKIYIYCSGASGEIQTPFYKYLEIQEVDKNILNSSEKVKNALKVRSKIFWNQKGIHDTEIDTILADWKRL